MTQISIRNSDLELQTSKHGRFGVLWIWARGASNETVKISGTQFGDGYSFALIPLNKERQFARAVRLVWDWQQIKAAAR